jgi:hypothetical protein
VASRSRRRVIARQVVTARRRQGLLVPLRLEPIRKAGAGRAAREKVLCLLRRLGRLPGAEIREKAEQRRMVTLTCAFTFVAARLTGQTESPSRMRPP